MTPIMLFFLDDRAQQSIIALMFSVISFLGVIGNLLVFFAVLLSRKLQTQTNVLVVNLCVADFLTSISLPFQAAAGVVDDSSSPRSFLSSDGFCAVITMLEIVCLGCSILTMTMIAVNRLIVVTRSKSAYGQVFPRPLLVVMIVIVWLIPLTEFGVAVLTGHITLDYYPRFRVCAWREDYPISKFLIGGTFALALFITLCCYVKIYFFVRRHARAVTNDLRNESINLQLRSHSRSLHTRHSPRRLSIGSDIHVPVAWNTVDAFPAADNSPMPVVKTGKHNHLASFSPQIPARCQHNENAEVVSTRASSAVTDHPQAKHNKALETDITKNLFLVVCAFVIIIVPFTICFALPSCQEPFVYTLVILTMSSCVNPIIYGFKHPHFRPVFKSILLCRLADIQQPSRLARKLTKR
ncbi:G-protein coupled receptor moody-like [Diadema antillarum]|uniref:G-protein coupled receptor moody-like n=1 Tax=Diadema antillarum TaxID=105358 RepID=UPI003A84A94A